MKTDNSRILTINAGSSSIRFALYKTGGFLQRGLYGRVDRIGLSETNLTFYDPATSWRDSRKRAVWEQIGRQFSAGPARTAERLGIGKGCGTSCRPPVQQYVGSKAAYLFTFRTQEFPANGCICRDRDGVDQLYSIRAATPRSS